MKNNITNIIIGCIAIVAAVFAVVVVVGGHRIGDGDVGSGAQGSDGTVGGEGKDGSATPDTVSVSPAPGGDTDDEVVTDQTAGYSFTMPTNWYLEPNVGSGVTVYPDYDPASGEQAACKIEISEIDGDGDGGAIGAANLNGWVTAYLHADPTAEISESSRTTVSIGDSSSGGSGSGEMAIEWQGMLNGVSTTLVYVAASNGKDVLEFAPSTLAADDTAGGDDCTIELQALLANLTLAS